MPFSQLLGNERAKMVLQKMLGQHTVPNTLLFSGPDGVGKARFAQALVEELMGDAHHYKIRLGAHADMHTYVPEGRGALHSIEKMRQFINEIGMPPFEAPIQAFVLHDAHQMLPVSSNALLKTLEEPSFNSYIILLTDQLDQLLPTIVSRCCHIPFFSVSEQLIENMLIEQHQQSSIEAKKIASFSQGSFSKALKMLQPSYIDQQNLLYQILISHHAGDYQNVIKFCTQLEEIVTAGSEEGSILQDVDLLFENILSWYRDLHLMAQGIKAVFYHQEHQSLMRKLALKPHPSVEQIFEKIQRARLALQRHIRLRVVLEQFFN